MREYAAALRLAMLECELGYESHFAEDDGCLYAYSDAHERTPTTFYILSDKEAATSFWLRCGCGWLKILRLRFFGR